MIARRARVKAELDELDRTDERMARARAASTRPRGRRFSRPRGELSAARRAGATTFRTSARAACWASWRWTARVFEVRFNAEPLAEAAWTASGIDAVEFFVSPNVGEDLRPLARIVSGGELSRIMLAVKTLTATGRQGFSEADDRPPSESAPGMIFDEVDAGIGGRAADVVGRKLRALGSAFQVLCITHLPQIAAYADTHYSIEKHVDGGRTQTRVARLDDDGRVEELARMLGGEARHRAACAPSAREMLLDGQQPAAHGGRKANRTRKAKAKVSRPVARPREAQGETDAWRANT